MRVEGLQLRVEGLGFRVEGLRFMVDGLMFRGQGLGLRVRVSVQGRASFLNLAQRDSRYLHSFIAFDAG